MCPATAPFDERFAFLFNSYYEGEGRAPRAAQARHAQPPVARRGPRLSRACRRGAGARAAVASAGGARAGRARHQPRAAAPGAVPHRHPRDLRREPARAGLWRAAAAGLLRGRAAELASRAARASSRSARATTASPSTASARATASSSPATPSPTAASPTANGASSSPTAAIRRRRCGCPKAGTGSSAKASPRRSTGATTAREFTLGRPARDRLGGAGRARQLSTRPTPSPAGPARGCRPKPSGRDFAASRRPVPRQPARRSRRGRSAARRRHVRRRLGMDRRAPSRPTPASRPPTARSANITASS